MPLFIIRASLFRPCVSGQLCVVGTPWLLWITAQWTQECAFLLEVLMSLSLDSHPEMVVKRTASVHH